MAKALTAAGIARYKPSKQRREIRDSAATGLYLILQESGQRSFALRFRKPNGKPASSPPSRRHWNPWAPR
jgi:hypothetical protein